MVVEKFNYENVWELKIFYAQTLVVCNGENDPAKHKEIKLMLKILYWNIKKRGDKLLSELETLSNGHDIIMLAEVSEYESKLQKRGTNLDSLINCISSKTGFQYANNNKNAWLHLWSRKGVNIELVEKFDKIRKPTDIADKECGDSEYFANLFILTQKCTSNLIQKYTILT